MSSQSPPEPSPPLLKDGQGFVPRIDSAVDMEANAGRSEAASQSNLDHEYSIPSTVKFTWLGTYFLLSLLLTIYNKLVLGVVCDSGAALLAAMTNLRSTVPIPMALDFSSYLNFRPRYLQHDAHGLL